jgi:hypothetical protein
MNYLEPYESIFFKTNKNGLQGWVRRILPNLENSTGKSEYRTPPVHATE